MGHEENIAEIDRQLAELDDQLLSRKLIGVSAVAIIVTFSLVGYYFLVLPK